VPYSTQDAVIAAIRNSDRPSAPGAGRVIIATGNRNTPYIATETARKPKTAYEVRRIENGQGSPVREGSDVYRAAVDAADKAGIALDGSHTEVKVTMAGGSGRTFLCRVWARSGRW